MNSFLKTSSAPEVLYSYNDGMARMKHLAQICLLWLRENTNEEDENHEPIKQVQESHDLFHQLLSARENQLQNIKNYRTQKPDPPNTHNPLQ